jgi:hypothetical protein
MGPANGVTTARASAAHAAAATREHGVSPQSLEEDLNEMHDGDATKTQTAPAATIRPRIPTRDLLAAIQQARRTAGLEEEIAAAHPPVEEGDAIVPPLAPEANAPTTDLAARPTSPPDSRQPWLPERDGPVSLAGVAAPRAHIRTGPRTVATPDKAARRPTRERKPAAPARTPPLDAELAAAATKSPPRLIVVAACGGAGATTLTVLMAAALAAKPGALVVTAGPDRGALSARSNAAGGDLAALAEWIRQHPRAGLQSGTPGLTSGDAGTGPMVLATPSRDLDGTHLDAADAAAVLAAAAPSAAAVLVDWRCALPLPEQLWSVATHAMVVAPYTTLGLLDAEYTVQAIESAAPGGAALSVAAVDVSGGGPRRGRAALARLRAHGVPVTTVARDPTLAADPRVHWPSLRPRTRAAVTATLTQALRAGPTHHLTSERNAP